MSDEDINGIDGVGDTAADDAAAAATGEGRPASLVPEECHACTHPGPADEAPEDLPPSYVFALGGIDFMFPNKGVEKELAQVIGSTNTENLTDRQVVHHVLNRPENRYLARQLCYVLTIQGMDTYILRPTDPADVALLVDAIRPDPGPTDIDVVIGTLGPLAAPQACNGLALPVVTFQHIYSFAADTLVDAVKRPDEMPAEQFTATGKELLRRVMQMTDNTGATDASRTLNFLVVRYSAIYTETFRMFTNEFSLTAIEVRPSRLSTIRNVQDAIFTFTNRRTGVVEKRFARVDVSDQHPWLHTPFQQYFDR